MNFNLTAILAIVSGLVGLPMLWAFVIDVLKWAGVVNDGDSGKWAAAFNALTLIAVAISVTFFPSFKLENADATLVDVIKFATLIFGYLAQVFVSKQFHAKLLSKILAFSFTKQKAKGARK